MELSWFLSIHAIQTELIKSIIFKYREKHDIFLHKYLPPAWIYFTTDNIFTGTGGSFRFANSTFPQYLSSGYSVLTKTGASFPNLAVATPYGLYLDENTDTHIRNSLQFQNGILWLNGNNLLIGVNSPGTINGYKENSFVGTENTSKGGYLYRAKISASSGSVVFPIGPQAGSYAPVAIMFNTITPQDLHARVFDDIYRNAFLGPTGSPASVQQTWNIGQENNDSIPAIVDKILSVNSATLSNLQIMFTTGITGDLGDDFQVKPSIYMRWMSGKVFDVHVNSSIWIKNLIGLGVSYRYDDAILGTFEFALGDKFSFGYSYGKSIADRGVFNQGTHEALIRLNLASRDN